MNTHTHSNKHKYETLKPGETPTVKNDTVLCKSQRTDIKDKNNQKNVSMMIK